MQLSKTCPAVQKKFWLELSEIAGKVKKDIENHDFKDILQLIKLAFEAYHQLYKLEDASDANVKAYIQSLLRHLIRDLKMLQIITEDNESDADLLVTVIENYYYPIKYHFLLHIYQFCKTHRIPKDEPRDW